MSSALIEIVDLGSGVTCLMLNRPEKRNALSAALLGDLADALKRVSLDQHCRVVVLAARGRVFSAGADVADERLYPVGEPGSPEALLMECKALMLAASQPIVARIHGDVFGGGIGLVAAADIVIAHDAVNFIFSEARLGLAPTLAASTVVPRIGRSAALRMMLLGERIPARLASDFGLVTLCVEAAELDECMSEVLGRLLESSPAGLASCKALVHDLSNENRHSTVAELYRMTSELIASPAALEAAAAAKAKHHPSWWTAPPTAEQITRLLGPE